MCGGETDNGSVLWSVVVSWSICEGRVEEQAYSETLTIKYIIYICIRVILHQ